ncbi:MAG: UvrB/UvrC motif-containing protein [Vicingaceae bacterium]|nr:UvrB/UvrC motif-containing protein [Vicingaceae bacterium]
MQNQEEINALQAKIEELDFQKSKAVKNKEYEFAALLRDRIKTLTEKLTLLNLPIDKEYDALLNNIATIYDNTPIFELDKAVYTTNILIAEYTLNSGTNFLVKGIELSTLVKFATKKSSQKKEHLEIVSEHLNQWIAIIEEMPLDDFKDGAIEIKIKNSIEFRYDQLRKLIKKSRK